MEQTGSEVVPAIPPEKWPLYLRNYAWDILPCPEVNGFLSTLTLHPSSEEGAEIEHRAMHDRLRLQQPMNDMIGVHSAFAARVLAAYALRLDKNTEIEPAIIHAVTVQFAENVQWGAQSIIAEMMADGWLMPGPEAGTEAVAAWMTYQQRAGKDV